MFTQLKPFLKFSISTETRKEIEIIGSCLLVLNDREEPGEEMKALSQFATAIPGFSLYKGRKALGPRLSSEDSKQVVENLKVLVLFTKFAFLHYLQIHFCSRGSCEGS